MLCLTRKQCFYIGLAVVLVQILIILSVELKLHLWFGTRNEPPAGELNGHVYADSEPVESFLRLYWTYCTEHLYPQKSNVPVKFMPDYNSSLCLCVPNTLVGRLDEDSMQWNGSLQLQAGGTWSPPHCVARQRVAVIIPFRDRAEHLATLLPTLHALLQGQQLQYTIYVVEQKSPEVFNKAVLMNAGFLEASAEADFDCYVFHDVDMIPEDDRNIYVCSTVPRHVGSHLAQWNYMVYYRTIFGGVTAFTKDQFLSVNGFSNKYYGWGGEDDDMYGRIIARGYSVVRFPRSVARYHMISHDADHRNPYNIRGSQAWRVRPSYYMSDGVSSIQYSRDSIERRPLYTWIYVTLPDPPRNFKSFQRTYFSSAMALRLPATLIAVASLLLLVTFIQVPR